MQTRKPVTLADRQRIESMFVTMTAKQIAEIENRPVGGIKEILKYSDVRKNRKWSSSEMELLNSDLSHVELAKLIDRTRQEVSNKRWILRNKKHTHIAKSY